MKYIILKTEHDDTVRVYPLVFPEYLTHSIVAQNMQRAVRQDARAFSEVLSAGFCELSTTGFHVSRHGSESLRIDSDRLLAPRDQRILNMPNAMQGIVLWEQ